LRKIVDDIIEIPDYLIEGELEEAVVYNDDVIVDRNPISMVMINRASYDKYLASKAVEQGTCLSIHTVGTKFSKSSNTVTVHLEHKGKIRTITCKILVGADGFASTVARWAGLSHPAGRSGYYTTYQYCMGGVDREKKNCAEFFTGTPYLSGGYAWVFPKRGSIANIGVCIHSLRALNPHLALNYFLKSNTIVSQRCTHAFPLSESSAPLHAAGPLERIVDDNIILVGEAAGHVDPQTGEGTFYAIAGGQIAGTICAEAITEKDYSHTTLEEYERSFNATFGNNLKDKASKN
jgi:digeranylgeranylglycerophospholipid reductase